MKSCAKTRVLHAALMSHYEPGIYRQMAWEQEAAEDFEWRTRIFTSLDIPDPSGILVRWKPKGRWAGTKVGAWINFRRAYYRWLAAQAVNLDVILVRHSLYDPFRAPAMRKLSTTVGSVHHTLELPELETHGASPAAMTRRLLEKSVGTMSVRSADLVIGVTDEIRRYELGRRRSAAGSCVYPNGVHVPEEAPLDKRGDVPELLFVAGSFHSWQGLDLLLENARSAECEFILHIVGNVDGRISRSVDDERIVFYGPLDARELESLSSRSWVGLSSFALERKGMLEACPLKVREYLSQGLPVYAGHVDVFPRSAPFYQIGPPDLSKIVEYAHEMRLVTKKAIKQQATPYIDKRSLVARLEHCLGRYAQKREFAP